MFNRRKKQREHPLHRSVNKKDEEKQSLNTTNTKPVSTLESLPNEILIIILNNINGVDIINAFAFQLNRRFDALIIRLRRLHFNFTKCHKDDFRLCLGLLPAYADKIEQLSLGAQYTPGQVYAFLLLYPSFSIFNHLRKLHLETEENEIEPRLFTSALRSISNTALHTLSIKVSQIRDWSNIEYAMRDIFHMKTLKKLSINCKYYQMLWSSLKEVSSNIEYLSIQCVTCQCQDLENIFRWAPGLRYLDISLQISIYPGEIIAQSSRIASLPQMPKLHTAVLNIARCDETDIKYLEPYIRPMASLHRLEIKTNSTQSTIGMWETLIETSFPLLTSLVLEITIPRKIDHNISNMLTVNETPFWAGKENFNVIVKHSQSQSTHPSISRNSYDADEGERKHAVSQWCIRPSRKMDNKLTVSDRLQSLHLSADSDSFLQNYRLNNVTHLFIGELNNDLLTLIITCINCSRIQHIDLSLLIKNSFIIPLLESTANINSLQINIKQLYDNRFDHVKYPSVRHLDISSEKHSFNENDISIISRIFPCIEHLIIFTDNFQNVPMLETYLPYLRSFTFRSAELAYTSNFDDYEENSFDYSLRKNAKFLFRRNGDRIIIWIDQAALHDSYWTKIVKINHSENSNRGSLMKKIINRVTSFFK